MACSKIILTLILGIFLLNFASAVLVYGTFDDSTNYITEVIDSFGYTVGVTVNEGVNVNFEVVFVYSPVTLSATIYGASLPSEGIILLPISEHNSYNLYTIPNIYTPGTYQIEILGSDNSGTDYSYLTLTINAITPPPVNNAPVITSTPITDMDEEEDYNYQVTATDSDGDTLTYSLVQNPSWLSIDSDGLITGTAPTVNHDEHRQVIIQVSDGEDFDTQTYTLRITNAITPSPINNAPVITSTPITQVDEEEDYSYQVTATDADGDALTYSLVQNPSWLSIDSDGLITGTAPDVNYDKYYQIRIMVSDGEDFDTQTYILKVNDDEEDEEEEDDEHHDDDTKHTHKIIRDSLQDDEYYQFLYFSQFQPEILYSHPIEEASTLSWFQKLINTLVAFFKWVFRLE